MIDRRKFIAAAGMAIAPGSLAAGDAATQVQHEQPAKTLEVIAPPTLSALDGRADQIARLPVWPTEGNLPQRDWRRIAELALALTKDGREGAVLAVALYWSRVHSPLPAAEKGEDGDRDSPRTAFERCLLLTRVMFDIPTTPPPVRYVEGGEIYAPEPCGSLRFRLAEATPKELRSWVGLPVIWDNGKPKIGAYADYAPPPGFSRGFLQEPHIELSLLWQMYPTRTGLQELASPSK